MIDIGIKIKDYLTNSPELSGSTTNIYNQFVDDSTVVTPFIVIDIDSISMEKDLQDYEYYDITFTINTIDDGYYSLIATSTALKKILVGDIQTTDYTIQNIVFDSYTEFYNKNYISKLTFKCKI